MRHRPTPPDTVETLKHEEAADPQPNLFANVNGPADDEPTTEVNQDDASCARWLHGLRLSHEASP
jgi:hypothetical protein